MIVETRSATCDSPKSQTNGHAHTHWPNSGIDAVRTTDGAFFLIYNHTRLGRSPLNLARRINALWNQGGQMYPPPLR